MKINKIQINGYGKLKDTKIELKNGINIIYGENEVGKSTLLNYITSTFYGISKNKKGKEMSDFERYTPWEEKEFSGKLEYELDNKNKYEVFRDFRKKNPIIYNEKMEDISKEFNIDKTKGNNFFYDQTKIDEDLFKSTFLVNQQEVKLEEKNQQMLIQKISNLVGTGEDNVSYKLAMDRLRRKQLDEVGTERSREKPINILTRSIEKLEEEKEELKQYENVKYEIEENKNEIQTEIEKLENENEIAKEIKKINEKEILEKEKLKIQEDLQNENDEKIGKLKNEILEIIEKIGKEEKKELEKTKEIKNKIKTLNRNAMVFLILLVIANILQYKFIKNEYFSYALILTIPILLIFYILLKNKNKKKLKNTKNEKIEFLTEEKNKIKSEVTVIEENNNKIKKEIKSTSKKINAENNSEKEKIKKKNKKLNKLELNNLLNEKNINNKIENIQNLLNKNKIKMHELEIDQENIIPKLENLSKLEENLENEKNRYLAIKDKEKSIELAREVLTSSYEKMKEKVTPKFTNQLSENIGVITKGRYSRAMYNEDEGLLVELDNGSYVNANKLSLGTIDQLYLSLRLSMIDDLSEEKLPIILDESFAFYDNKRLKNILKYLSEKFEKRQIIIFTCTNREKEILENEKIKFNYIRMNDC